MTPMKIASGLAVVLILALSGTMSRAQEAKTVQAQLKPAATRTLAPDFALEDGTGKIVRLSDYRGRVVLLDFWATECGGCVQEIPMFIEVANAYKRRGLEAIGVSEDIVYSDLKGPEEAWKLVKPFALERKIPYPIVMGDSRVTAAYEIKALPLTQLVDKQGRVAATYLGVVERKNLESNINALIAEAR